MENIRILVYQKEDCNVMLDYLQICGFSILTTTSADVEAVLRQGFYDLCILDEYETSLDSLRLLKIVTAVKPGCPVLFLSATARYEYIIQALNAGADDYVVKPCNFGELIARIKALARRSCSKLLDIKQVYKIGDITFNTKLNTLEIEGNKIKVQPKEGKILALLCAHKNEPLSKETILSQTFLKNDYVNRKNIDFYICKLRDILKIDPKVFIKTEKNIGYILTTLD